MHETRNNNRRLKPRKGAKELNAQFNEICNNSGHGLTTRRMVANKPSREMRVRYRPRPRILVRKQSNNNETMAAIARIEWHACMQHAGTESNYKTAVNSKNKMQMLCMRPGTTTGGYNQGREPKNSMHSSTKSATTVATGCVQSVLTTRRMVANKPSREMRVRYRPRPRILSTSQLLNLASNQLPKITQHQKNAPSDFCRNLRTPATSRSNSRVILQPLMGNNRKSKSQGFQRHQNRSNHRRRTTTIDGN
ncbi:hypothetical protein F511_31425 [Dorcoceras hygrometricum]|uniref:Uncharacterized protein n=1 Tax=Dorcoceras hygrometricum TaxID=472368 RepID=A0A2Z7CB67_9LAMI|nr:hypothetical protein F511_31425 [Dorcoceras hygrometricum]